MKSFGNTVVRKVIALYFHQLNTDSSLLIFLLLILLKLFRVAPHAQIDKGVQVDELDPVLGGQVQMTVCTLGGRGYLKITW